MKVHLQIIHLFIAVLFVFQQSPFFWLGFQKEDSVACSRGEMGSCCRGSGNGEVRCKSGEPDADEGMCYVASSCHNDSEPNMVVEIFKPYLSVPFCTQMPYTGKSLNFHCDLEIYSDVKLPCHEKPPEESLRFSSYSYPLMYMNDKRV